MTSAPSKLKSQEINKIIYLSRLFNNNLADSNILCFYRMNNKFKEFNSFKTNIQKSNFCHLMGLNILTSIF